MQLDVKWGKDGRRKPNENHTIEWNCRNWEERVIRQFIAV